jgi:hypothetical protein
MTFRELLTKYKNGTLTEEEKILVEQELEKSEAINDYLAEEIEKSLDQESNRKYEISNNNIKEIENIDRSIKKTVNRRLAFVAAASVFCVFAIILVIQYIISPLVANHYYDPTKKTAGQEYQQDLSFDLRGITEVSMPGYAISHFTNAQDLGFGKYNLTFTIKDLFTKLTTTVNTQINKGMHADFFVDYYSYNYFAFSEFWDYEEGTTEYQKKLEIKKSILDEEIDHVRKLPSTSYISAWARFTKDMSMEELNKIKSKYKGVDFKWIAVRTAEKQGQQLMGFSTGTNDGFVSSESVDEEKYPGFQLVDLFNFSANTPFEVQMANIYEIHFTSLLKYLVDHHEAVTVLVGDSKNYDYKSALKYIEKNGMTSYGVLLYGEADTLLELYESGTIMTFDIDNVIASKYIQ